jgi:hypothetical protein
MDIGQRFLVRRYRRAQQIPPHSTVALPPRPQLIAGSRGDAADLDRAQGRYHHGNARIEAEQEHRRPLIGARRPPRRRERIVCQRASESRCARGQYSWARRELHGIALRALPPRGVAETHLDQQVRAARSAMPGGLVQPAPAVDIRLIDRHAIITASSYGAYQPLADRVQAAPIQVTHPFQGFCAGPLLGRQQTGLVRVIRIHAAIVCRFLLIPGLKRLRLPSPIKHAANHLPVVLRGIHAPAVADDDSVRHSSMFATGVRVDRSDRTHRAPSSAALARILDGRAHGGKRGLAGCRATRVEKRRRFDRLYFENRVGAGRP